VSERWKEWILDISWLDVSGPCFVPYERETDLIVFGFNMITDRSPGKLVAVIHEGGQEAVEEWCAANPNWATKYGPVTP
jgi:hypothetical protein